MPITPPREFKLGPTRDTTRLVRHANIRKYCWVFVILTHILVAHVSEVVTFLGVENQLLLFFHTYLVYFKSTILYSQVTSQIRLYDL